MNKPTFEKVFNEIVNANIAIGDNEYLENSFGSWYITVLTVPKRRLVWDGKESWCIVQEEIFDEILKVFEWRDIWIDRHPNQDDASIGIEKLLMIN